MTFQEWLYNHLQTLPAWTMRQGQLSHLIESSKATPLVASLEQAVRSKLGIAPSAAVDWSALPTAIDWVTILAFIEQLLAVLLPIITSL